MKDGKISVACVGCVFDPVDGGDADIEMAGDGANGLAILEHAGHFLIRGLGSAVKRDQAFERQNARSFATQKKRTGIAGRPFYGIEFITLIGYRVY